MTIDVGTQPHPIFLAGRWVESPDVLVVDQPGRPGDAGRRDLQRHARAQYEEAVEAAVAAFEMTPHAAGLRARARSCATISAGIKARREELGRLIALEAGKPIRDALVEVDRAVLTFRLGAEEAERMTGEVIPLDLMASSHGPGRASPGASRSARSRRSARSTSRSTWPPTSSRRRSPSGNSIVLKPPSKDPLTMLTVAEIIDEAGLPAGCRQHPADDPRAGRPDGRRRALQAADLHRQPVGRLADEGARRQEEGRPRARRQRRGHRRPDAPTSTGRSSAASSAPSAMPARSASASSGCSSTRRSGTSSWTGSWPAPRRAQGRRSARSRRPTSGRWSTRPPPAGPSAGSTRRVALGGKLLLGGHGRRHVLPADDPDRHAGQRRRSARTRRSRRSSWPSRSATSTTRSARSTTRRSGCRPASSPTTWPTLARVRRARGRRRDHQRRPDLPDRPHALRRGQGLRPRPRGPALGDRGHDRDPDHGHRPRRLSDHGRARRPADRWVRGILTWSGEVRYTAPITATSTRESRQQ